MVVHIGVVVLAVGLAAATAYGHRGDVTISPGQRATFSGHTVEFVKIETTTTPSHTSTVAVLRVDGRGTFSPAVTQFGANSQPVGTPAVDSGARDDVYLTIDSIPATGNAWTFGVVVQPLVTWLWVGGLLLIVGSALSAVPGRRRRPTDPVSAPSVAADRPPVDGGGAGVGTDGDAPDGDAPDGDVEQVPVGAGDAS
jgi:cytochrome c-type biogenesis protein CcmF